MNRRVVVTGIGLVCGSGNTKEEVWSNLLAGRGAIGAITRFDAAAFPVRIA
ncbi:MAG TPA: beta-ketoacyl synthase N-terminal-like domain-containing protein, partial [Blastocatellia bacterium]